MENKPTLADWIQIAVAFLSFCSIWAFIIVSCNQSKLTREAITKSDIANTIAKRAFDSTMAGAKSSDELNRKAIQIAESSMKVSSKIANMQEDFTKKELRAYLVIEAYELKSFESNKRMEFIVHIKNMGKTPASIIIDYGTIKIGGTGIYENEMAFNENNKHFIKRKVVPAGIGTKIGYSPDNILSVEDSSLIMDDRKKFFIRGIIIYTDVFGDKHRIRYCKYLSASHESFADYPKYNDEY